MSEVTRVTQAGQQIGGLTGESDVRVTQAGLQVIGEGPTPAIRVTQAGVQIVGVLPYPTQPDILSPYTDQIVTESMYIRWTESIDPLGGTPLYFCRIKLQTDTVWTWVFQDREEWFDGYWEDISGLTDGDWEMELWAENAMFASTVSTETFVVHNGLPTQPEITAPYDGQEWQNVYNDLEWEAATDPDDDPLTHYGRYRAVGAGSWNNMGSIGTSPYNWNMTGFGADDYEVEVWAEDAEGPGPADRVVFSIVLLDRPGPPRIRIVDVGTDYVTVQLWEYSHPQSRPWQATRYELIPYGGDWDNPAMSYETTDSDEQYFHTFEGLPHNFMGVVRGVFQDDANNWGVESPELLFCTLDRSQDWVQTFDTTGVWSGGAYVVGRNAPPAGLVGQARSAIADSQSEELASCLIEGYGIWRALNRGWIGKDTEFAQYGICLTDGTDEDGDSTGVFLGLDTGIGYLLEGPDVPGSTLGNLVLYIKTPTGYKVTGGPDLQLYMYALSDIVAYYGQPIGPWMGTTPRIFYHFTLWIQRNVATNSTRIRGRLDCPPVEYYGDFTIGQGQAQGDWDIDLTVPYLTECGRPGFFFGQFGYRWPTTRADFFGLTYTPLRDEGLEFAEAIAPLTPWTEPEAGACTEVSEDAPDSPVFFPAPPNGDVIEEIVFPSDVIQARDDTEQRIGLRETPTTSVRFQTTLLTSREVAQLHALLWEEQPSRWAVPLWMDAARLNVDLAASSGSIPASSLDTQYRRFERMSHVALWVDQFTWELFPAVLESDGSITLTGTTSQDFDAFKTYVIPCLPGIMIPELQFDRSSPVIGDLDVRFLLEGIDE